MVRLLAAQQEDRLMEHKPAMFALLRLHAELGGKILENKNQAARLAKSMMHVEAVIKLFDPSFNLRGISIRRRYKGNPWFKRGTLFRKAMETMRGEQKALTAREIANRMLAVQGIKNASPKAVRDLTGAVNASLRNHKGGSVKIAGEGMPARWTLATNRTP